MRRPIAAAITATAAVLLGAGGARADSRNSSGRHALHANGVTAAPTVLDTTCSSDGTFCRSLFHQQDVLTGDINGRQDNAGSFVVDTRTFKAAVVGLATFSGTVQGCPGAGTALIRFIVSADALQGHNSGTLDVVPGTGTAGLAGLRGSGSVFGTFHADGSITSEFVAQLRCDD